MSSTRRQQQQHSILRAYFSGKASWKGRDKKRLDRAEEGGSNVVPDVGLGPTGLKKTVKEQEWDTFEKYLDATGFKNMTIYDEMMPPLSEAEIEAAKADPELDARMDLGDDYTYNPETGAFYNAELDETRVPIEKSHAIYKQRRSKFQLDMNVKSENFLPDFITEDRYFGPASDLGMEREMKRTREKYNFLNYDAVKRVLSDADTEFFSNTEAPNPLPWGPNLKVEEDPLPELLYEKEMQRFLAKLPKKYVVAQFHRGHMTNVGKKPTFGILVLGGTGKGAAGFGYGAGADQITAMRRATMKLRKNLVQIPMDEGRTIPQSVKGTFSKTFVLLLRRPRGAGVVSGPLMRALADCIGLEDFTSKVLGKRHPLHTIYAAFKGLLSCTAPRDIAHSLGLNYYREFDAAMREKPPTKAERERRNKNIVETLKETQGMYQKFKDDKKEPSWRRHNTVLKSD